jgi:hypothetical protein
MAFVEGQESCYGEVRKEKKMHSRTMREGLLTRARIPPEASLSSRSLATNFTPLARLIGKLAEIAPASCGATTRLISVALGSRQIERSFQVACMR